ncbi:ClbS/DfsB family four-helix bundle protein [Agromyces protaetiae]|uniref:ClbS/DfsB family four-helix bundle protein n=1 Tax=Agromyces protaetiae TaxID=2509455 RepID=A0A4P6FBI0_9MICO|nr:ClbS/DfsB family four-helix bundle protein [Agromyces protaetiae]QAY73620.1 ClbS/DfsB family four-helix bundle protein [Agromyces protaetiae]
MGVPANRVQLEASAVRGFHRFDEAIEAIPVGERDDPFPDPGRDRDIRDLVNHLHAWHVLLLGWLDAERAGKTPAYPADGYTWAALDALNHDLRDRYRDRLSLADSRERLRASHLAVLTRIESLDDDELFEPARRDWLGGPLAEPVHECLGGHYAWALEALDAARA